ncbi:Oxygen-insensitive NADPH nitroreductase [Lysobacter dokdonensis DS-58]|uniref:Putative NAD(P)H nitroreductase n=1 Tax=Lysobacter dokdonensis DS-58 TaxID=1300345 RepID=A0A0A2WMP6_9GAMM|nr:nitroreductase [Lysobacter dokdonensis]KGQ19550.1 Oxygen-insensitive NADPH nitroreductase [Lysobacter dokdonensis DS-58]
MSPVDPDSSDELHFLNARRSVPAKQLGEPGPDPATLARILAAAVRVPDHGKRVPFRFIRIAGQARHALGERLVARTRVRDPQAGDGAIEKDRNRFAHAPLVLVVVAKQGFDEKIPESERFSTAACVCFALLQAAQACGFGAQWLTGWPAYDPEIAGVLGLAEDERISGFLHIGTPKLEAPERDRPDPQSLLTDWSPA